MRWSLRAKMLAAFVVVLVITTAVAAFGYKTQLDRSETIGWIDHTNEVMMEADQALMGLINMETGFRGYLATGDERFLEPYNAGQVDTDASLKKLMELTSDNPTQVERWKQVESDKNAWLEQWVAPGLELRQQANGATASASALQAVIAEGKGKAVMDEMRSQLALLESNLQADDNLEGVIQVAKATEDLVNRETGMRGFVLTGDEKFLEPYEGGQQGFADHLVTLRTVLAGDAANLILIDTIESLADQWKTEAAEPWIAARREVNANPTTVEDVSAYLSTGGGKQFMDAMRAELAEARGEPASF